MTSRPIAAADLPDLVPGTPPTKSPEVTWIAPTELLVDEVYQRAIGDKGLKLIRKIVEGFDWRRFKPPTCVWTDAGLEVIDGQHSAIAAATHPGIESIPVMIVEAEQIADRASAFVGLNKDRLTVSAIEMHAAAAVAGDPAALAIDRVCAACGVTVLRVPRAGGIAKSRDLVAVRAVGDLIRRVGEDLATAVLRVLAEADLAPITAPALRAAEAILMDEETAGQVDPVELTRAIVALGADADKEAAVFAGTHSVPRWRGYVAVWFRKVKKRKPGTAPTSDEAQASSTAASARRVILRPVAGGAVSLGDPAPGRSALDQRAAGGSR